MAELIAGGRRCARMSSRVVRSHLMGFRSISMVYQNRYKCLSTESRHAPPIAPRPCRPRAAMHPQSPCPHLTAGYRQVIAATSCVGRRRYRPFAALQNRVTPGGEIMATDATGGASTTRTDRYCNVPAHKWLICRLEFNSGRGELMSPDRDSNRAIVEGFDG